MTNNMKKTPKFRQFKTASKNKGLPLYALCIYVAKTRILMTKKLTGTWEPKISLPLLMEFTDRSI